MIKACIKFAYQAGEGWGVYIHVPFCVSRCAYCDFNTYSGMYGYTGDYFRALGLEMDAFWRNPDGGAGGYADTVFFGGGTPTSVDPAYIAGILRKIPRPPGEYACEGLHFTGTSARQGCRALQSGLPIAANCNGGGGVAGAGAGEAWECTVEANPGTLDSAKLDAYAAAGVNRLSVGLQSTHDAHLKLLGRIHTCGDFISGYNAAKSAGFTNISADLLFGIPGQTADEWERTLEAVVSLGIGHLSCYSLSVEEGTPLHKAIAGGDIPAPDEDVDRDMYHFAVSYLRSAGLYQYELSNFAKPGLECRHNLKYWTGAKYRGFGAGAHSYDGRKRFSNVCAIDAYIKRFESVHAGSGAGMEPEADPKASKTDATDSVAVSEASDTRAAKSATLSKSFEAADMLALSETSNIDATEKEKEFIILRLRLTEGFSGREFKSLFGCDFFEKYAAETRELIDSGLAETRFTGETCAGPDPFFRLTPKGMDLANQAFLKFI